MNRFLQDACAAEMGQANVGWVSGLGLSGDLGAAGPGRGGCQVPLSAGLEG
ncbi:MAG: hypothetical protein HC875_36430 [Anaerolineales bacterium]|nr:hypothetical protein [Anaerolineales bacterium]